VAENGKPILPPEGSTNREAVEAIAKAFGCPVEEAHRVLVLGIEARIAEQNARKAEQDPRPKQGTH
jgi:hypothetical protein